MCGSEKKKDFIYTNISSNECCDRHGIEIFVRMLRVAYISCAFVIETRVCVMFFFFGYDSVDEHEMMYAFVCQLKQI